jgi:hypothetical protein
VRRRSDFLVPLLLMLAAIGIPIAVPDKTVRIVIVAVLFLLAGIYLAYRLARIRRDNRQEH